MLAESFGKCALSVNHVLPFLVLKIFLYYCMCFIVWCAFSAFIKTIYIRSEADTAGCPPSTQVPHPPCCRALIWRGSTSNLFKDLGTGGLRRWPRVSPDFSRAVLGVGQPCTSVLARETSAGFSSALEKSRLLVLQVVFLILFISFFRNSYELVLILLHSSSVYQVILVLSFSLADVSWETSLD